ncbi:carbamoyltransferase [Actinoplanes ianthinogenes]|uniref:acylphosphatase n=1 Tax=Actinoplanes ianthinogenes TaxID=122358 RepID=A0ABM7M2S9_9ACTN|nr:carbamoyltransferase HypF [Actinoplanes ianthinogenes]BCJ45916.1 carbamoyltransferase [Actinoplanes ianthinogenes]GGR31158.1 carbamoyltransferase [Actinoplanes ianthinogenes]
MCLGIPGRVLSVLPGNAGQLALVDVVGAERQVNIGMLDAPPAPDDWVLIHLGFAVEIIDAERAARALGALELIGRPRDDAARIRRRYTVSGLVQGVGFRPFAYAVAGELALAGSVVNTVDGVVVEVEGDAGAVHEYGRRLRDRPPPLALVTAVRAEPLPAEGGTGFTIGASGSAAPARTLASPDVAICADCLAELHDPADRRHRHPFISCVNCGPRFTIIESLPYDRATTTMAGFPMCAACEAEYRDPADRRFHAQPIACPDCGPRLELIAPAGAPTGADALAGAGKLPATGADALAEARRLLAAGRIVAVKGLGGYHLACDATSGAAVAELRRRKNRGGKPFAVMVTDLAAARRLAEVGDEAAALLTGVQRPIVLLPRRPGAAVAAEVAPDTPDLGILLPYTPLHVLLLGLPGDPPGPPALVMTSGNRAGEPIVTGDAEAVRRLTGLADAWLRHDREIRAPCDDSVSRPLAGGTGLPIRRSRGYAPLPLTLPFPIRPTLAVGADLKNTCALGDGRYAWLSQHLGDLDELATLDALTGAERHLERLTGVRPEVLAADPHPGYRSTGWARAHAAGRPVRLVQHHHAHIAAVMAEHGLGRDERVIGFAFDGTGYGPDGAIWGGEVLIAGYRDYRRAAHLGYVPLAGGDASVRRTYRMALAHLRAAEVPWDPDLPPVAACPPAERRVLDHQLATGLGCAPTSSVGRLFDAVAALAGVRQTVAYEAEAAIVLEGVSRARGNGTLRPYENCLSEAGPPRTWPWVADPAPLIRAVAGDVRAGLPAAVIGARFHATLAGLIGVLADRCRTVTGLGVAVLGGGVFQNTLLIESATRELRDRGFTVLRPGLLPPSDGGLALGQLAVAGW